LLDFLAKRKNSSFPERKPSVSTSGNKEFPHRNQLLRLDVTALFMVLSAKSVIHHLFATSPDLG